jgi:DNA-binding MarR family transcriptional regulator
MGRRDNRRGHRPRSTAGCRALWLDDFLPYRAGVAAGEIARVLDPQYQRYGLTLPEIAVLSVLAEETSVTQQTIVVRSVMEKFTISRAARALLGRGLVERSDHATDGRSHLLSLTAAGRRLYAQIVPLSLRFEERLMRALGGPRELERMKRQLLRLQRAAKMVAAEQGSRRGAPEGPRRRRAPRP